MLDQLPPHDSRFNPMDAKQRLALTVLRYAGGRAAFTQEDLDEAPRIALREYWEGPYWIVAATDQRGS